MTNQVSEYDAAGVLEMMEEFKVGASGCFDPNEEYKLRQGSTLSWPGLAKLYNKKAVRADGPRDDLIDLKLTGSDR